MFFSQYQYYWDREDDDMYIFHNNWVVGKRNKELRMREMHMYMLDVDGEYSDSTRKYLTYEVADSDALQDDLMKMVKMANALNRTLVLPPTRCKNHESRRVWCNMCTMQPKTCFLSVLVKVKNGYRESVFFTNAKVPDELKEEDSHNPIHRFDSNCIPDLLHNSNFPANQKHNNHFLCHSCQNNTSLCQAQFGYKQKVRVLKFYSV